MKAASRSKSELRALINEKSGKQVVVGSWGCYGDYDGNGGYELFAFVADSSSPYLSYGNLISENRAYIEEQATGCALWFSNGEQTVQVAELTDGYWELSMDIVQFGESMQCVLTRLLPDKYSSVDEILSVGGYATTVCVVENGDPRVNMEGR